MSERDLKPRRTEPVEGHGGTNYENLDAQPSLILWSLGVIVGIVAIVFAMTIGFQKVLEQGHSTGELPSPLAPTWPAGPGTWRTARRKPGPRCRKRFAFGRTPVPWLGCATPSHSPRCRPRSVRPGKGFGPTSQRL